MKKQIQIVLAHLLLVMLALEFKNFYEKGGHNNDLAYSIMKIILLIIACLAILNSNEVVRIIIEKTEEKVDLTPRKIPQGVNAK